MLVQTQQEKPKMILFPSGTNSIAGENVIIFMLTL